MKAQTSTWPPVRPRLLPRGVEFGIAVQVIRKYGRFEEGAWLEERRAVGGGDGVDEHLQ